MRIASVVVLCLFVMSAPARAAEPGETGACCLCDGCIEVGGQSECFANPDAVSFHPGLSCATAPCEAVGSCCRADGSCVDGITEAECEADPLFATFTVCETCADVTCADVLVPPRLSTCTKGSLFILPKVEVRWDESGTVVEDTLITLANDAAGGVTVRLQYINGDEPIAGHPGWNYSDFTLEMPSGATRQWSAADINSFTPFRLLDLSLGRPDPQNPDWTMIRGFVVGWAVTESEEGLQQIRHNHLAARATIVNYEHTSACAYNGWHSAVTASVANGAPVGTPGVIELDGDAYASPHAILHMNFPAAGGQVYTSPGAATVPVPEVDLTLLPLELDFDDGSAGPTVTKAHFDVWNENSTKLTGADRCVSCWDATLLSLYDAPNHFTVQNLQSDVGRARIDGLASFLCPGSVDSALVGVTVRQLAFAGTTRRGAAGVNLVGAGIESATIRFSSEGPPPPLAGAPRASLPDAAGAGSPVPAGSAVSRPETAAKGSVLILPDIEVRWTSEGELIRDTFVHLSNDWNEDVRVRVLMLLGEGPSSAPVLPGYRQIMNTTTLAQSQPIAWSVLAGTADIPAWTTLEPQSPTGRPAPDGSGDGVLRGSIVAWAVDAQGRPIDMNHLAADAITIDYDRQSAWATNAYHLQSLSASTGEVIGETDSLRFDGVMYASLFDEVGSSFHGEGAAMDAERPTDVLRSVLTLAHPHRQLELLFPDPDTPTTATRLEARDDTGGVVVGGPLEDPTCVTGYGQFFDVLNAVDLDDRGSVWAEGLDLLCPDDAPFPLLGTLTERFALDQPQLEADSAVNLVGRGLEDAAIAAAVQGGACCLSNGGCQDVAHLFECYVLNGSFYSGSCANVECPDIFATGACCLPDGGCISGQTLLFCGFTGGTFQGPGSGCAPTLCEEGACCDPDGSCTEVMGAGYCGYIGGFWQGNGTLCGLIDCSEGACCLDDGDCVETQGSSACAILGGTWLGEFTSCGACAAGACCIGSSCETFSGVNAPLACETFGGIWQGYVTNCGQSLCDTGACCLADDTCTLTPDGVSCTGLGGTFLGGGTNCVTAGCGTGACCVADATCYDALSFGDCATLDGVYLGDLTTCDGGACPQGACCFDDGGCLQASSGGDCSALGGIAFIAGESCVTTSCLGACCLTDGSCANAPTPVLCASMGGVSWTEDAPCDGAACGPGACCYPGGECLNDAADTCALLGGTYLGSIDCADVACESGACCLPEATCVQSEPEACYDLGGFFVGGGTDCVASGCIAPGAVRRSRKISSTEGGFTGPLGDDDRFGTALARIGDVDGDGIDDLAVGATLAEPEAYGAIYILFLNADGSVRDEQRIDRNTGGLVGPIDALDLFGSSITGVGDLNGDGTVDIAVGATWDDDGGTNTGAVYVLYLNPDGTVQSEQKISATQGGFTGTLDEQDEFGFALSAIGDLDGDGVTELAVGARLDDDGAEAAGAVWILFLNADGSVDASHKISATTGSEVAIALESFDIFGAALGAPGDVSGDGVPDLFVGAPLDGATDTGAVWILHLSPNGTVTAAIELDDAALGGALDVKDEFGYAVLAPGDLNGDGIGDIVAGAPQTGVPGGAGRLWVLFLGGPSGPVDSMRPIDTLPDQAPDALEDNDRFGRQLATIGDLDDNGLVELAVGTPRDDDGGTNRGAVWLIELEAVANVTWDIFGDFELPDIEFEVVGDFNGDDFDDIVFGLPGFPGPGGGGAIEVFINQGNDGDGAWQGVSGLGAVQCATDPDSAVVGDFDDDDDLDLAVHGSGEDVLQIFLNDGAGGLVLGQSIPLSSIGGIAAGDFDEDGRCDLAVTQSSEDQVLILTASGAPPEGGDAGVTFLVVAAYPVSRAPKGIHAADLDGDGDDDLAISAFGAPVTSDEFLDVLFLEQGALQLMQTVPLGAPATALASGDFDRNGARDIALAYRTASALAVVGNDGAGGFALAATRSVGITPTGLAASDIDGDGDPDLAVAADDPEIGRTVHVFENRGENRPVGTIALAPAFEVQLDGAPRTVAAGDFNRDGRGDLVLGAAGSVVLSGEGGPPPCPGDLDGSGDVGFADLLDVLSAWGACPPECPQDLDGDGNVGFADLLAVLSSWGACP